MHLPGTWIVIDADPIDATPVLTDRLVTRPPGMGDLVTRIPLALGGRDPVLPAGAASELLRRARQRPADEPLSVRLAAAASASLWWCDVHGTVAWDEIGADLARRGFEVSRGLRVFGTAGEAIRLVWKRP